MAETVQKRDMTVASRDEMFDIMIGMSDRQLDNQLRNRLKSLRGRPHAEIKDFLLGIIDDAVFAALGSDWVINALHCIWIGCGGSEEELRLRNATLADTPENRSRYGWQR